MIKKLIACALFVVALPVCFSPRVFAQVDRAVKEKQGNLKTEYNDAQEKNQIIRSAAADKPRATVGLRRTSTKAATGYDYTQVKGFTLRQYHDRIDKVFARAADLGLFDDDYHLDGAITVGSRKGNAELRTIEVYYVETTQQEEELFDVAPYEIIEIHVVKLENLAAEVMEGADEGGDEGFGGFGSGASSSESVAKNFHLSGSDLVSVLQIEDEALYDDILSKRSQSLPIALPERGDWMPGKVGPFIVMSQNELETTTSRFSDFWNTRDTLTTKVHVPQFNASGPFYELDNPVFYPDLSRIRIRNPENRPVKITNIQFVGPNADEFEVKSKFPIQLTERSGTKDNEYIEFACLSKSSYELKGFLLIEASEAGLTQTIEVLANPGLYPSDFVTIDASLDKIELRSPARSGLAPNWKLNYTIGNDEVGLPRWSTGISSISIGFKNQMSVGVVLPMNMIAPDLPGPLAFEKGLLSSAGGYTASFDFTFGFPFSLGGSLYVINDFDGQKGYDHLRTITQRPLLLDEEDYYGDFFHISTIAQVYYPIMFKDKSVNPNVAFRLNIGGGYMQVRRAHLTSEADIGHPKHGRNFTSEDIGKMFTLGKEDETFDVYVRMSFINLGSTNRYGLGVQYFAGRMMADAFLELTSWLRMEAKYSFLLRARETWESETSYFMISPRLRIGLPSIFN